MRIFSRTGSLSKGIMIHGVVALVLAAMTGCGEMPISPEAGETPSAITGGLSTSANSPFKVVRHDFSHDIGLWSDGEIPGEGGWCGDIEQVDRGEGPVRPSKGGGYALVSHGPCNAFWTAQEFTESAPYGPAETTSAFSSRWLPSGFVHELDVYLDPAWQDLAFQYAISVILLDLGVPDGLRHFAVDVERTGAGLMVDGFDVTRAGWYTFGFRFSDESGGLGVEFELRHRGRILHSKSMNQTLFTLEDPATFDVESVGSGYSWFVFISPEDFDLPIDEQLIRPGS